MISDHAYEGYGYVDCREKNDIESLADGRQYIRRVKACSLILRGGRNDFRVNRRQVYDRVSRRTRGFYALVDRQPEVFRGRLATMPWTLGGYCLT